MSKVRVLIACLVVLVGCGFVGQAFADDGDDIAAALSQSLAGPGAELGDAPVHPDIITVLQRHRWHRTDAARTLGISRTTLWRRLRDTRAATGIEPA